MDSEGMEDMEGMEGMGDVLWFESLDLDFVDLVDLNDFDSFSALGVSLEEALCDLVRCIPFGRGICGLLLWIVWWY